VATSAVPDVIDALVAAFDAVVETVYDGPQVTKSYPKQFVAVGWDGEEGGGGEAATFSQRWGPLGARRREEDGTITCAAVAWSGDTKTPAVRNRREEAFALLAACENALRADPPLGATVRWGEVAGGSLIQEQTGEGVRVRVPFTVSYVHRI